MRIKSAIFSCLIILACALSFSSAASAAKPSPATLAQAEELVQLLGMDQVMRDLSGQAVLPLVRQVMAADPQFTPEDLEQMSQAWQVTVWHDLKAELISAAAGIYANHLSAEEITQALAFFKSPLGRKLVATQPKITGQSRGAAEEVVKAWLTRINADPKLREDFFNRVAEKLPPELRKKTEGS
jgi:hypothetical protein